MSSELVERKDYSADQRKKMAANGQAMPDGSYPIADKQDLKNAIQAYGRGGVKAGVKAHIIKRARALGATDLLPEDWRSEPSDPPRDMLVRAVMDGGVELRDDAEDGNLGTLNGHFAVFDRWTMIDSAFEGRFLERIAPGAFKKTFDENRAGMRVLFQHGRDPQIGDKPLGPIGDLRETDMGAYYEVPLLDTAYNRELLPGLRQGLYGASFRFRVMRQQVTKKPSVSEANPDGVPERTILEAGVKEFGPVTFPAYEGATAGVRSLTDEFLFASLVNDPDRLRKLLDWMPPEEVSDDDAYTESAPPETRRPDTPPASGRRRSTGTPLYGAQRRREPSWLLPR